MYLAKESLRNLLQSMLVNKYCKVVNKNLSEQLKKARMPYRNDALNFFTRSIAIVFMHHLFLNSKYPFVRYVLFF